QGMRLGGGLAAAGAAMQIGRMPLTRGSLASPLMPSKVMTPISEKLVRKYRRPERRGQVVDSSQRPTHAHQSAPSCSLYRRAVGMQKRWVESIVLLQNQCRNSSVMTTSVALDRKSTR